MAKEDMMKCPNCKDFDVGEAPWKEWERCPNCDMHPTTAMKLEYYRERNEELERFYQEAINLYPDLEELL